MKLGEFYFDKELDEIVPAISTATTPPTQQPAAPAPEPAKGQMPTDPMKAAADAKAAQAKAAADKQEQIKGMQDAIKAKEQELMDLRKQMAELQKA